MPTLVRRAVRPLLVMALVAGVLGGCWPSVGTNFGDPGPFEVTVQTDAAHTYYSPSELGPRNLTHPVVLWGNGTFLNPTHYDALLRHLASHGFIVAAANTSNAGSGREMLAGLDNLTAFNSQQGNRFYGKVDLTRVATVGHSQGGGGAIEAARDARVDTTVPIQPWMGDVSGLRGTAFFLSGQNDTTIPPATVRQKYDASSGIPAAYGELAGADHLQPIVNGNGYRAPVTAWLRWKLLSDQNARDQFVGDDCAYCTSGIWTTYVTNPLLQAQAG
jgi:hypothetical protein